MSLCAHRISPGAAAGGLDRDDVVFAGFEGDLVGKFGLGAVTKEQVAARGAGAASRKAPGAAPAAVGLQRDGRRVAQDLHVAADPLAAGPPALAAGALTQLVAADPQRVGVLEGLGGGVLGVRHAGVDAVHAGEARAAALPAADGLVVRERRAADDEVVHR